MIFDSTGFTTDVLNAISLALGRASDKAPLPTSNPPPTIGSVGSFPFPASRYQFRNAYSTCIPVDLQPLNLQRRSSGQQPFRAVVPRDLSSPSPAFAEVKDVRMHKPLELRPTHNHHVSDLICSVAVIASRGSGLAASRVGSSRRALEDFEPWSSSTQRGGE